MSDTVQLDLGQGVLDDAKPTPVDVQLWSVTTIIGALDKPALVYWAADETAKAAVERQDIWRPMADADPAEAVEWLKKSRFRRKGKSDAELGSAIHAAVEGWVISGVRPSVDDPEMEPFLDRVGEWLDEFQPSWQASEVTVYHPQWGYAGTSDGFLTVDGTRFIIDFKTSRKSVDGYGKVRRPYPEVALQLAAYRYAELAAVWRPRRFEHFRRRYYLLSPEEQALAVPVPEVDGALAIHVTPEHCHAWPVRADDAVFDAFLYVVEAARWQFGLSKTVLADAPLEKGMS